MRSQVESARLEWSCTSTSHSSSVFPRYGSVTSNFAPGHHLSPWTLRAQSRAVTFICARSCVLTSGGEVAHPDAKPSPMKNSITARVPLGCMEALIPNPVHVETGIAPDHESLTVGRELHA